MLFVAIQVVQGVQVYSTIFLSRGHFYSSLVTPVNYMIRSHAKNLELGTLSLIERIWGVYAKRSTIWLLDAILSSQGLEQGELNCFQRDPVTFLGRNELSGAWSSGCRDTVWLTVTLCEWKRVSVIKLSNFSDWKSPHGVIRSQGDPYWAGHGEWAHPRHITSLVKGLSLAYISPVHCFCASRLTHL